jgi:hypothetical protein
MHKKKLDAKKHFSSEKNDFEKMFVKKKINFLSMKHFLDDKIFWVGKSHFGSEIFSIQKMFDQKTEKCFFKKSHFSIFSIFFKIIFLQDEKIFFVRIFLEERSRSLLSFLRRYDI